eukprot:scaffold7375_cov268-Pinguiococcus_pyrenoidosus.AAC.29
MSALHVSEAALVRMKYRNIASDVCGSLWPHSCRLVLSSLSSVLNDAAWNVCLRACSCGVADFSTDGAMLVKLMVLRREAHGIVPGDRANSS